MEYLEESTNNSSLYGYIQEWIMKYIFEITLVIILLLFIIYKYSNNEISLIKNYKLFVNRMYEKIHNLFGKLWLKSSMVGGAIKTKSVSFNEDENIYEEYEDKEDESGNESEEENGENEKNQKSILYI